MGFVLFRGPDVELDEEVAGLFYLFIFRERGREGEREQEKHQYVVASHLPPTGDLACNPGMCPDWESNLQPFGLQACTPSTELHKPGHNVGIIYFKDIQTS